MVFLTVQSLRSVANRWVELDKETLGVFLELLEADAYCPIMKISQLEYRDAPREPSDMFTRLATFMPDFRMLEASELPLGVDHGATFKTVTIDVPRYLLYLLDRFLKAGGRAFRVSLPSLSSLLTPETLSTSPLPSSPSDVPTSPAAIINCTGIGARSIGDVLGRFSARSKSMLTRSFR